MGITRNTPVVYGLVDALSSCPDAQRFPRMQQVFQDNIVNKNFSPELSHIILSDRNLSTLVVLCYAQRIVDASVDAEKLVVLFIHLVLERYCWLAEECISRGMKLFGLQVLSWTVYLSEQMAESLHASGIENFSLELKVRFVELIERKKSVLNLMITVLASELVEAGASNPDRVKVVLNSYCQLIYGEYVRENILEAVKSAYEKKYFQSSSKPPCLSQVLANCGTGIISHKPSYKLGNFHVDLALFFFELAQENLPNGVCAKQKAHLEKNIQVAKKVKEVRQLLEAVWSQLDRTQSISELAELKILAMSLTVHGCDLSVLCSTIKFVMLMTVEAGGSQTVEDVSKVLLFVASLFKEVKQDFVSNTCKKWAGSVSVKHVEQDSVFAH